jgi:GNAT superfamily N-acetyltransferase
MGDGDGDGDGDGEGDTNNGGGGAGSAANTGNAGNRPAGGGGGYGGGSGGYAARGGSHKKKQEKKTPVYDTSDLSRPIPDEFGVLCFVNGTFLQAKIVESRPRAGVLLDSHQKVPGPAPPEVLPCDYEAHAYVYYVHYIRWDPRMDEWVTRDRIRLPHELRRFQPLPEPPGPASTHTPLAVLKRAGYDVTTETPAAALPPVARFIGGRLATTVVLSTPVAKPPVPTHAFPAGGAGGAGGAGASGVSVSGAGGHHGGGANVPVIIPTVAAPSAYSTQMGATAAHAATGSSGGGGGDGTGGRTVGAEAGIVLTEHVDGVLQGPILADQLEAARTDAAAAATGVKAEPTAAAAATATGATVSAGGSGEAMVDGDGRDSKAKPGLRAAGGGGSRESIEAAFKTLYLPLAECPGGYPHIRVESLSEALTLQVEDDDDHHDAATRVKNVNEIILGRYIMPTWYYSPFPEQYKNARQLHFCPTCLSFFAHGSELDRHARKCRVKHPPGNEIYRSTETNVEISMFEVDGLKERVFCESLCYIAKLFLDHKTLFEDCSIFLYYVLCEVTPRGCEVVGYFSKEKVWTLNNLACILTLPCHQRKGYGKFLISMSYELARIEGRIGGPERPLSDLVRTLLFTTSICPIYPDLPFLLICSLGFLFLCLGPCVLHPLLARAGGDSTTADPDTTPRALRGRGRRRDAARCHRPAVKRRRRSCGRGRPGRRRRDSTAHAHGGSFAGCRRCRRARGDGCAACTALRALIQHRRPGHYAWTGS